MNLHSGEAGMYPATEKALLPPSVRAPLLTFGRVYRLHSKNFGTHDILVVRSPGHNHEETFRGLEVLPNGETRELLHASSFERDTVEKEWPNLLHYYAESARPTLTERSPMIDQPIPEVQAKIDDLFPTDGVYAFENNDGMGKVVHRIVCIRDGIVHAGRFPAQHKHRFFDFFELHLENDFDDLKAVRLDTFTNA